MQNKEQKRVLSVQAIAGLSAVSMIARNLFAKWDARLHAQRAYFTIQGDKNASLEELMPYWPDPSRSRWHQQLLDLARP